MKHGGVVPLPDASADLREAVIRQLPRQVHGDLTGRGDLRPAVAREDLLALHAELDRGGIQDFRDARYASGAAVPQALEYAARRGRRRLLPAKRGVSDHAYEGALEGPHAAGHAARDLVENLACRAHAVMARPLF